jgi:SAM-dependent methyltransferase
MGTAQIQGSLWGERVQNYARIIEPMFSPAYTALLDATGIGMGTRFLDVGCGPGLAAQMAAQRGARVSGLDAAEVSTMIAQERTPEGDFQTGEMERLPWADVTFDVVTSFNAFQFAGNPLNAIREAKRVVKSKGKLGILIWGSQYVCETLLTTASVTNLLLPPVKPASSPPSTQEGIEALLKEVALSVTVRGEIDCPFEFPDLETAVRGLTSAGMMVAAARQRGLAAVEQAVAASLEPFQISGGRYLQKNRFRYLIAEA